MAERIIVSFHVDRLTDNGQHWCARELAVRQITTYTRIRRRCGATPVMTIRLNDQSWGADYCLEHGIQKLSSLATEANEQKAPLKATG